MPLVELVTRPTQILVEAVPHLAGVVFSAAVWPIRGAWWSRRI
jgi:hypothetical protein